MSCFHRPLDSVKTLLTTLIVPFHFAVSRFAVYVSAVPTFALPAVYPSFVIKGQALFVPVTMLCVTCATRNILCVIVNVLKNYEDRRGQKGPM